MKKTVKGTALLLGLIVAATTPAKEAGTPPHAQICSTCHGTKGVSTQPQYPILAGQEMYYMYLQLKDFRDGRRKNPQMAGLLDGISDKQLRAVAEYFAAQDWPETDTSTDPEQVQKGKQAAASGECTQCHLGGYTGNSRIPRLAGQHREYLEKTLLDYKNDTRTNSPAMNSLIRTFSESDIKAMAEYLSGL
jgi:cytochrome c553